LKEFANLFDAADVHIDFSRIIANHPYGTGQEKLGQQIKYISSGGRVTTWLKDLEQADLIILFKPFSHNRKGVFYKLIDEYSLFYFNWIESIKESLLKRGMRKGYWENVQNSPSWYTWAGYAFEALCYKHISKISVALEMSPTAVPYTWRYVPTKGSKEQGAQIDLLFDRKDNCITVCEIKYTNQPFVIDKYYAEQLKRKIEVFRRKTATKKHIFLARISTNGIKKTIYSEDMVEKVITLDDLSTHEN